MANEAASNMFGSDIPTGELKERLVNAVNLDNFIQSSDKHLFITQFAMRFRLRRLK
jgi:hypothetical protein